MKQKQTREQLIALLHAGSVRIYTNHGEIDLRRLPHLRIKNSRLYETSFAQITVSVFGKGGDTIYRRVDLKCKSDLTLYRIDFLTDFPSEGRQFMAYNSFINAPAAAFIRYGGSGFFTGVENPFFTATEEMEQVCLSYEPSLLLKQGENYESEPQFLGSYLCTGKEIKEKAPINREAVATGIRRGRFFNPCGEIALDLAEIDAMRNYVSEYYGEIRKGFDNILYFFFYPRKKLPQTEAEVQEYLSIIDRFEQMSGTLIAFNPHVYTSIPTDDQPYWVLAPEHSPAERILRYAQAKGMQCGYYMGCAFNGDGGNAALLPFMPQKTQWKKKDAFGNLSGENCLGCDEYAQWWYTVQANTIRRYQLGYWAWDPGPGNGNDCYAENHGHIPGKGEYKGWRNSQKLLAKLKETFPELFLMSFYGRKEYGIWGFKYFSQHEVYWEQTIMPGATLHTDPHDDRVNAHGTRLQNQWSMNFRFLPAQLGHGLVPRMGESYWDPDLDRAYDFGGWKYALISAIACCGSVTHCNIPDRLENIPGFSEFYRKWITWAKENYDYCRFTKPIGSDVSNEVIDGFSRIHRDSGQIFLFNSSPKIMNKKLVLDQTLGLDTSDEFRFNILFSDPIDLGDQQVQYRSTYRMGDILDITLPPYGAVVLEITHQPGKQIQEIPRHVHTIDRFTDESGNEFSYPIHSACSRITLNAKVFFRTELKDLLDRSHIASEDFLNIKIPEWRSSGLPFTFVSALPHRLTLYLPFDGPKQPLDVQLTVNDLDVPVEVVSLRSVPYFRFAYIEDFVKWGQENQIQLHITALAENSFLGLYVDYPEPCNGMDSEEIIFPERSTPSPLHPDPSLIIDSFEVTPSVLPESDSIFTVSVKTAVDPAQIEGVYFLHPTQAQMPALEYDPDKNLWTGTYHSGIRSRNIFCNSVITAWIRARNGGIGPRAVCRIQTQYCPDTL